MAMHKQVDPLPIGARYYYKSERVQVVDYHQLNPLFSREYVVASLVTGETRRVFRNELLRVPIDYPPSTNAPEEELEHLLSGEMMDDSSADKTCKVLLTALKQIFASWKMPECRLPHS